MSDRPIVLVELGCFTPALRASGPNASLVEAVSALSDRFRFRIIAEADEGEAVGQWHLLDGCERIALRRGPRFAQQLVKLVRTTPHDLVVCNGFFDHRLTLPTLLLHRAGLLGSPLLLAPRGEFSPGALKLSKRRKQLYVASVRTGRLLERVRVQATDAAEASRIRAAFPAADILIGPNIRRMVPMPPFRPAASGSPLRLAFTSRIDRMKNLEWGLRMLANCRLPVQLDIFGPVSNADYWRECQAAIAVMPPLVEVRYRGILPPAAIIGILADYDLFFLPTLGENFGHSIADTLLAGTPALIADTTPWRGLGDVCAGADLSLADVAPWHAFLTMFHALSATERMTWRTGARKFAERRLNTNEDIAQLAECFEAAMQPPSKNGAPLFGNVSGSTNSKNQDKMRRHVRD